MNNNRDNITASRNNVQSPLPSRQFINENRNLTRRETIWINDDDVIINDNYYPEDFNDYSNINDRIKF